MGFYSVRGRTTDYTGIGDDCVAALWNPHATKRIRVLEAGICLTIIPDNYFPSFALSRITARGTPGATITPAIQQSFGRRAAPVSGALLDLALYSVLPTREVGNNLVWQIPIIAAYGFIYPVPRGIEIPPAAGLAISQIAPSYGAIPISEVWFCWEE